MRQLTSATDLLLAASLEAAPLYETVCCVRQLCSDTYQYMKNYPFADARVRREAEKNPGFQQFLSERNTTELTQRRDIVSSWVLMLAASNAVFSLYSCRGQSRDCPESCFCSRRCLSVRRRIIQIKRSSLP
jgi:hypothetical protein